MKGRVFVDTNILIYAHDLDAGIKHEIAAALIERLWEAGTGVVSTQVLQELYVNVTRKLMSPLPRAQARGIIECYLVWHVELNDAESILMASELEERYLFNIGEVSQSHWHRGTTLFRMDLYDAVATDDARLVRKFKMHGIPFILPALIFYRLWMDKLLAKSAALGCLEQLAEFISEEEYSTARLLLERDE